MTDGARVPPLSLPLDEETGETLRAERLRDGRVALGAADGGEGALHLLSPRAAAALAGWLAPVVEETWEETLRGRLGDALATADGLYPDEPERARRHARDLLDQIPPRLLARALTLLANSIGPASREEMVRSLNRTADRSEEAWLRRRLAEEGDAFAYVVAAAALLRGAADLEE